MRASAMLKLVRWCTVGLLISTAIGGLHDTEALLFEVDEDPGIRYMPYLRIMHIEENFLLIGARNKFYNISTATLGINREVTWVPFAAEILYCQREATKYGGDCNSYVRSAVKMNETLYHICTSSAKKAACRKYELIEGVWTLGVINVENSLRVFLAPVLPWNEIRKLRTTDTNTTYVAGHYLRSGNVWQPLFFRGDSTNLAGDPVGGLRSVHSDQLFKIDYSSETATQYKSIFEVPEYVYLTYTEPALETFNSVGTDAATYSRIARVCKNDRGRGSQFSVNPYQFATLFKTRLLCGNPGTKSAKLSDKYFTEKFRGFYASYINEIADSSNPHISSVKGADGEDIMLAIFNSPGNSPGSSAICAYKISDINRVFDTSAQIAFNAELVASLSTPPRPAGKCYNDSTTIDADAFAAVDDYLLSTPIQPINKNPLFLSSVDYRMTHIVVDWQVEAVDGKKYDIIFVSTDDGRIIKFVKFAKPFETEEKYHVVEERDIFPGKAIKEMELIQDNGGKKHLIVNTLEQIKRIAIEKCHFYTDCCSCVAQQDPYCSWSPSVFKCVSTAHVAGDKYQNISSGQSAVCALKSTYKTVSAVPTQTTQNGGVVFQGSVGATQEKITANNSVLIGLVVTLPIIFGGLAFLAGFFYSKKKYMNPTLHLDELTHKSKDDFDKTNSDAYEPFPKQTNLQMVNNLNGKSSSGYDSGTLNRQKQVYV